MISEHDLDVFPGIDCTMIMLRFVPELSFYFKFKDKVLFLQFLCFSITFSYDNNVIFYDDSNPKAFVIVFHFSKKWGIWANNKQKGLFGVSLGYLGIYLTYGKEFLIRKKLNK